MNIAQARDEMARRMIEADHRLCGAAEMMKGAVWSAEVEANWERMIRRCDRRNAAWKRLAAAASRVTA